MKKLKIIGILILCLLAIATFFIWVPIMGFYLGCKEFVAVMERQNE